MTTGIEREPTWYDHMMEDEARIGDAAAESKWHGPRPYAPVRRYNVVERMDAMLNGTWTPPEPQASVLSLNASFDEAVRKVRAEEDSPLPQSKRIPMTQHYARKEM